MSTLYMLIVDISTIPMRSLELLLDWLAKIRYTRSITELNNLKTAPDFTLPDQDGIHHKLSNYLGKWVLVYFYPKDDTPGCTTEACSFRDGFKDFEDNGIQIFGISHDSVASHKKFAEKFKLNFPLLADEDWVVCKAYGAFKEHAFLGFPGVARNSYLINPEGKLVKEYIAVKPMMHAAEILKDVEALSM